MSPLKTLRVVLLLLCVLALQLARAEEQEKDPTGKAAEAQATKEFQTYAKGTAAAYAIKARVATRDAGKNDQRQAVLREEPILRWSNPLGGRKAHGEVFLWTDAGRPAAVLSLYQFTFADGAVREHHEFCSLSTTGLATSGPDGRDWSPAEPGVTMAPLADAPEPAASQRQRLTQMRELAGRFAAKKTTVQQETRSLRLLPQPVHRFESKPHEVTDGALFTFVEATDPEVFLLLEARLIDGNLAWHYALARMNSLPLVVSLGDKEIWHADGLPARETFNRKDKPYTAFTVK